MKSGVFWLIGDNLLCYPFDGSIEDEKLIRQVSEYIKTHEGSAKVIDEMEFRLADLEEGLTKLVENDITLDEMKRILSEAKDKYGVKLL